MTTTNGSGNILAHKKIAKAQKENAPKGTLFNTLKMHHTITASLIKSINNAIHIAFRLQICNLD